MHESSREDTFTCSVAEVDESAARHIESIVPAVRIVVFVGFLDPSEDLDKRIEFNLTIGQVGTFLPARIALASALLLRHN